MAPRGGFAIVRRPVSERLPVPRFDPSGPAPGFTTERRRRLLVLAAGALVLALVVSSVANARRASLRCVDGQLVPYRGRLLPAGEEPLADDAYPALRVPVAACEDELFESHRAFEDRYVELALSQADPAERPEDRLAAETAIDAIDAMGELPTGARDRLQQRRRALLERVVEQKVEQARESQQQAFQWIERARRAGADPAVLRAAERSLGLGSSTTSEPTTPSADVEPAEPPPHHETLPEPTNPRPL